MAGKITNFFKMASRLKFSSLITFYKLKYFTNDDKQMHRLGLKNGLELNVKKTRET